MTTPHFVFAGGGTGGHLYPGLAVAEAVRAQCPDARITFMTTERPLDRQLLEPTPYNQIAQPVRPATAHPLRLPGFVWAWQRSVAAAKRLLRAEGVCAVLGLGGYAAGPPVVAGRRMGLPTMVLNPDAIPGRANRFLARYADRFVLQWDVTRQHFPPQMTCETLGCPIRPQFVQADPVAGRAQFGLDPTRPVLLVTGASQGAYTVNEAMQRVWPQFHADHPDWQLLHLSGAAHEAAVQSGYAAAGAPAKVVAFTHEMWQALAAADVVVARAGASTVAELTALGKPAVLLPYPYHRDRHQHANARVLVEAGAAVVVEDERDAEKTSPNLLRALKSITPAEIRAEMALKATKIGIGDAAAKIAERLLKG